MKLQVQALVRSVMCACLASWSCGPVLLAGEADPENDDRTSENDMSLATPASTKVVVMTDAGNGPVDAGDDALQHMDSPDVVLSVKSLECGTCFDLSVSANGGLPPYRFEWEDGSKADDRVVCVDSNIVVVSVFAEDASFSRSPVRVASLLADTSVADCPSDPLDLGLCLMNPSFEGTAALNTGQVFDAPPWSPCVDSVDSADAAMIANTPEIASNTLDPASGIAPAPSEGKTYLALAVGEQASQTLCAELPAQSRANLKLDAMRFDIAGTDLFLQVWGGSAATCSQTQLLWASPPLNTSWQTYCATLAPNVTTDQITLRAASSTTMMPLATNYLAVDHLVPVSECP